MLVIIRGNSCSGKSTIAEKLRDYFGGKTAVMHTSMFYYGIVQGDSKEMAMENTRLLLNNYLKNGYNVILEGTLSFKDEKGKLYFEKFEKIAKKYKIPVKSFFFQAEFSELKKREKTRKKITIKELKEKYDLTTPTKRDSEIIVDTTNKSINKVISEVKKNLK